MVFSSYSIYSCIYLFWARTLLPECEDDQVVQWPIDELRERDWSEKLNPRYISIIKDKNKNFSLDFLSIHVLLIT
jgi:hypothetical protein